MAKGEATKGRILDVAQGLVLAKGFSGTSIDEILVEAEITKGGFFYHFRGKSDLARELMRRYLEEDERFFSGLIARSRELVDDPLQRVLVFLKLFAEAMEALPDLHPGCLVASYTYEAQQFDPKVRQTVAEGMAGWRSLFSELYRPLFESRQPRADVTPEQLADALTSIFEGAIMVERVMGERGPLVQQILLHRQTVRLLFENT